MSARSGDGEIWSFSHPYIHQRNPSSRYSFRKALLFASQQKMKSRLKNGMVMSRLNACLFRFRVSSRQFFTESALPPVEEYKNAMSTVGSQGMFFLA